MQDKIYELLVEKDEISWKAIIYELIKTEKMNPWDVDISLLANRYIERIKRLKETDLKLGGKVILAAALLLKIKSKRLVGEDLNEFDRLLASGELSEDEFYDSLEKELRDGEKLAEQFHYELMPRLPQPRKRKVSVYELVRALEKALEVKRRRVLSSIHISNVQVPEKKFDITAAIKNLYHRVLGLFRGSNRLTFKQLLNSETKEEKVFTFIPLLHLANQRRVDLCQKEHFGEIEIIPINTAQSNTAQNNNTVQDDITKNEKETGVTKESEVTNQNDTKTS